MSLRIGNVKGIPIRLHFTLIISGVLIAFTLATGFMPFYFPGLTSAEYWTVGIIGSAVMFVSVLLHELAHSIVAQRYGIKVREIVLFVFGGVSDISEELKDSGKELRMAAAGPAVSFLLASMFGLTWWIASSLSPGADSAGRMVIPILYYGAFLNAVLGAFNLVPAFPSDGGRILRSFLMRRRRDYAQATKIAARIGIAISYAFMAFGFFSLITGEIIGGIWILLLGWFLRSGAESYIDQIRLTSILSKTYLRYIMNTNIISVSPSLAGDLVLKDYFNKYMKSAFPVVDESNVLLGMVTLAKLMTVPEGDLAKVSVKEIMLPVTELIVMEEDMTGEAALDQMTRRKIGKVFVCDKRSKLIGLVTKTDILNVEMERAEIARALSRTGSPGTPGFRET